MLCWNGNCQASWCGDGVRQNSGMDLERGTADDEECDDGNRDDGDGCSNQCTVPVCGNGAVEGGEECDDGNESNLDACLNTCVLPVCGNADIEGSEECDDGNSKNGDGCDGQSFDIVAEFNQCLDGSFPSEPHSIVVFGRIFLQN